MSGLMCGNRPAYAVAPQANTKITVPEPALAAAPNTGHNKTEPEMSYTITQTDNRVCAVDEHGTEICGAYQDTQHSCWSLYVTQLVTDTTHLHTPPHREHFWGNHGRVDSQAWIETIAALYIAAHHGTEV